MAFAGIWFDDWSVNLALAKEMVTLTLSLFFLFLVTFSSGFSFPCPLLIELWCNMEALSQYNRSYVAQASAVNGRLDDGR